MSSWLRILVLDFGLSFDPFGLRSTVSLEVSACTHTHLAIAIATATYVFRLFIWPVSHILAILYV